MSDIPLMNGITFLRTLRRLASRRGWPLEERSGKGSHIVVILNGRRSSIPQHRDDMKRGLYHGVLKQLGITPEDMEE